MHRLKTTGYFISVLSVLLLATVAWPRAAEQPLTLVCLIGGVSTSILGMGCRWLSYEIEERRKAK